MYVLIGPSFIPLQKLADQGFLQALEAKNS